MDPTVPLVVPEVNPEDARGHRGIIAGPNCSTTQMVVALWPIPPGQPDPAHHRRHLSGGFGHWLAGRRRAAGPGGGARRGRSAGARRLPAPDPPERDPRDRQLQGRRPVRRRAQDDRRDAQDLPRARLADQRHVRARARGRRPSEAIHIELERPMQPDEAREILRAAPGVVVVDDPRASEYPMPLSTAAGRSGVRRPRPQGSVTSARPCPVGRR